MKHLLCLPLCATALWAQATFDDSAADRLRVSSRAYVFEFSKQQGGLLGVTDRAANARMDVHSRNGCLWSTAYQANAVKPRGGCDFAGAFQYRWDAASSTLRFEYGAEAVVTLVFRAQSLDLQLSVVNRAPAVMEGVLFPAGLTFANADVRGAYVPYYLPGVHVKPAWFATNRSWVNIYPGARAFIDYTGIEIAGGMLAYYSVNPTGRIRPVQLGYRHDSPTSTYALHTFQTNAREGERVTTPVVRMCVGQSVQQVMRAYAVDNGIAAYPSLKEKLGAQFDRMARAPLVKLGWPWAGTSFAEASRRLEALKIPALVHPVSYWARGFDKNYPDFLPPNTDYGATSDFQAFVEAAHARGHFVMPYTNPTWWDDQSPTVREAGGNATFAVMDAAGRAKSETYGPNSGFAASPYSPAVLARLDHLARDFREQVKVDFLFEDQVGARGWTRDYAAGTPDPLAFSDGWVEHTRRYAAQKLMTEDGWDRVAATEVGFCGSVLNGSKKWDPRTLRWGEASRANESFGAGNWEPSPLGIWLFHDKVLFYHHDLSHPQMNAGAEVLTWNCAFGVQSGYLWPEVRGLNQDWVAIVNAFQPNVIARTAGRVLDSYRQLKPEVTESRFGDLKVIANWDAASPYVVDGYTVAPSGLLARSDDGALVAGVFEGSFAGAQLSAGAHYLVIQRDSRAITVRHPAGVDTSVTVDVPATWKRVRVGGAEAAVTGHRVAVSCARSAQVEILLVTN